VQDNHIRFFYTLILTVIVGLGLGMSNDLNAQNGHQGKDHSGHNHAGHNHDSHAGHNHAPGEHGKAAVKDPHAGHNHAPGAHGKAVRKKVGVAHDDHNHGSKGAHAAHSSHGGKEKPPNVTDMIMHHIADANEFHIVGDISIPLPCIMYHKDRGLSMFLSNKLGGHHESKAYNGYVMNHGRVEAIKGDFPSGLVDIKSDGHGHFTHNGKTIATEASAKIGAGSSFYDFSITKNVFTMLLAAFLLLGIFFTVAKSYKRREGLPPSGLQSVIEPMFVFIRDEVAKPMIPHKWEKYMPFLMTLFFFILIANLLGLVPFFPGSANLSGNIAFTAVLAFITLLVVSISGNAHYWKHIFWMPGVPTAIKPVLAVVEGMGIILKPFVLMLRLFANITGGHIVVLSLVSLIWIFGNYGESLLGSAGGAAIAVPFVIFISMIELLVAFLQAFIFTILTALYIGSAVEEPEHH